METRINSRTFLVLFLFVNSACKVSEKEITGKYFDKKTSDTLSLFSNKTYAYVEKLDNGELGWNTGSWSFNKKYVSFFDTKPVPVVGYGLQKTIVNTTKELLQIQFLLNDSKEILEIKRAIALLNNKPVDVGYFSINLNLLTVNNFNFDSLSIFTSYFPAFSFKQSSFKKNKVYQVIITPNERLYELDKFSYRFKKNNLINSSRKIRFIKISNIP